MSTEMDMNKDMADHCTGACPKGKRWVIATRGSALALAQAAIVQTLLKEEHVDTQIHIVATKGDHDKVRPLTEIGGHGLFVKEVERELLSGNADIAVHSGKDLPYELAKGTLIAGIPKAADGRDCLVTCKGKKLPEQARIGTGSPRRAVQIPKVLPGAVPSQIRGNIDTRLRKLREGAYDGIFLAKAGLDRLQEDISDLEVRVFSEEGFIPAACQGILAVQCREDAGEIRRVLEKISDPDTFRRFRVERCMMRQLAADCTEPVGVRASVEGGQVTVRALYGAKEAVIRGAYEDHGQLCREMAEELRNGICGGYGQGGRETAGVRQKKVSDGPVGTAGTVTLVGAGCGRGLITVKGLMELQAADTVVYDDLIDTNLLLETKAGCEHIYVGKRMGKHSSSQEEIHAILEEKAREGRHVVRLKGGDSFVFGRGGEELFYLQERGIPYEVIPGVSSSVAVPGHAGIPVTHRGQARSVTVVTGHTADGGAEDPGALASLEGNLVFLMGMGRLGEITGSLLQSGKAPDTPAAVIAKGYTANEVRIDGTLSDIAEKAKDAGTPAVFVVGPTAGFRLERTRKRELDGISVTVTGTRGFVKKLERCLSRLGADVDCRPCLQVIPDPGNIPEDFSRFSWVVFTSANGVEIFFEALSDKKKDLRQLASLKFACIGPGTAQKLAGYGIYADLVPEVYTARELGKALCRKTGHILILRAENGSLDLNEELDRSGAAYTDIPLYRTEKDREWIQGFCACTDYIIFGSAYGAEVFLEDAGFSHETVPVCIGPSTEKALGNIQETACLVPEAYTVEGIVQVLLQDIRRRALCTEGKERR